MQGKTLALRVNEETSIEQIKQQIQEREGIPVSNLHLKSQGKLLHDKRSLRDQTVYNNDIINMVVKQPIQVKPLHQQFAELQYQVACLKVQNM